MIYKSRDYTFDRKLDCRVTQYRCPNCFSYDVASKTLADICDGQSRAVIGGGIMTCGQCNHKDQGNQFELASWSHKVREIMERRLEELISNTGDTHLKETSSRVWYGGPEFGPLLEIPEFLNSSSRPKR